MKQRYHVPGDYRQPLQKTFHTIYELKLKNGTSNNC